MSRPNEQPTTTPMKTQAITDFIVSKEAKTITVERSFAAKLDTVWAAWTEADKLCQWWAPKPYACVIAALDFRSGGRWSYSMQGPEGDRHYCFFDYEEVRPKTFYSGRDAFCDEQGNINTALPSMHWELNFRDQGQSTSVRILIHFKTEEDLDAIVKMGFKEGFTQGMDQLDELIANTLV